MDCSVEGKVAFVDGHAYHFATMDAALAFAECVKGESAALDTCATRHGSTSKVRLENVKAQEEAERREDDGPGVSP